MEGAVTPSRSRFLNLDTTDISNGIILLLNHFFILKIYSFLAALVRGLLFVVVGRLLINLLQSTVSRGWIQKLWQTDLVAPRQEGSSWTRDQTCVPGIGRWVLNHWTTREVLGWNSPLLWGTILCIAGCLAASVASTHQMPVASSIQL